jgi:hypothetical protein
MELTQQEKIQDTSISSQVFKDICGREIDKISNRSFIMCQEIYLEGVRDLLRSWK